MVHRQWRVVYALVVYCVVLISHANRCRSDDSFPGENDVELSKSRGHALTTVSDSDLFLNIESMMRRRATAEDLQTFPEKTCIGVNFEVEIPLPDSEQMQCFQQQGSIQEGMVFTVLQDEVDGVSYEIVSPLELELGMVFKHSVDFAYQPVVRNGVLPFAHHEDHLPAKRASRSWWQWWRSSSWSYQTNQERFSWYNMDGAFAGGSHGQVWRGQRKCTKEAKNDCIDPHESLIFKRILVGHGAKLLEAGLREIYFGELLQPLEAASNTISLFSQYVDHFFLEEISQNLELWIVFKDAGQSMRNLLYTGVHVGELVVYQNSWFWKQCRQNTVVPHANLSTALMKVQTQEAKDEESSRGFVGGIGSDMIKTLLRQILQSASVLHSQGIVHRDIKPSNVFCNTPVNLDQPRMLTRADVVQTVCVLGDFSSAYNSIVAESLYTGGPSQKEQTGEYAPPEAIFASSYAGDRFILSPAFDSWSIGIIGLELLLGTPSVFSVDQRTR